ncbi:MAG: hypothetical protein KC877_03455 [Candidatus Kaiserbacteria bacterium]|nr:hypothetical protein [Candidatus Kaiserbacteria bacterium]MCB9816321.1 hypothetical protein [Candidatus Nomurabacteria bacterium]
MNEQGLVSLREHGIRGINYYWDRREQFGLTEAELAEVGITGNEVLVHMHLIDALKAVDAVFRQKGYELYVKEGYRPVELYELVYQKRVESGKADEANRLFNMTDMPHATGLSVDVTLWDIRRQREVYLRDGNDGVDALFVDFYKRKPGEVAEWYQVMQEWVIEVMQKHGFRLGTKREYFHFDYRPGTQYNYPISVEYKA